MKPDRIIPRTMGRSPHGRSAVTRGSIEKVIAPSKRVSRTLMNSDKQQRLRLVPLTNACRDIVAVRDITSGFVRATQPRLIDDAVAVSRPSPTTSLGEVAP
jgi:hypothetical protein